MSYCHTSIPDPIMCLNSGRIFIYLWMDRNHTYISLLQLVFASFLTPLSFRVIQSLTELLWRAINVPPPLFIPPRHRSLCCHDDDFIRVKLTGARGISFARGRAEASHKLVCSIAVFRFADLFRSLVTTSSCLKSQFGLQQIRTGE